MNMKGFTLIELLAVIAILAILMLLVVPRLVNNYKDSKKEVFYDNVIGLYDSAETTYVSSGTTGGKYSSSGRKLDAKISDDIIYEIDISNDGKITKIYVESDGYVFSKENSNGLTKKDLTKEDIKESNDESALATMYDKILSDNPTRLVRNDFSKTLTVTNTNTLYTATESINGSVPVNVYYFAGNAKNNWVKFGGYYWRIIRTNHDRSIRLLYAGTTNDTTKGYIGESVYTDVVSITAKTVGYKYGGTDEHGNSEGDVSFSRRNEEDSAIKKYIDGWFDGTGNKIYTSINKSDPLINYVNYLSKDAVYCNDRGVANGSIYDAYKPFYFISFDRLDYDNDGDNANPSYNCDFIEDAFSVNNSKANLKYPIALISADELSYAGGVVGNYLYSVKTWFYNNKNDDESIVGNKFWWTMTPVQSSYNSSNVIIPRVIIGTGELNGIGQGEIAMATVNGSIAIRPVISLKSCTVYKGGDGSADNPYEIEMNGGC